MANNKHKVQLTRHASDRSLPKFQIYELTEHCEGEYGNRHIILLRFSSSRGMVLAGIVASRLVDARGHLLRLARAVEQSVRICLVAVEHLALEVGAHRAHTDRIDALRHLVHLGR